MSVRMRVTNSRDCTFSNIKSAEIGEGYVIYSKDVSHGIRKGRCQA